MARVDFDAPTTTQATQDHATFVETNTSSTTAPLSSYEQKIALNDSKSSSMSLLLLPTLSYYWPIYILLMNTCALLILGLLYLSLRNGRRAGGSTRRLLRFPNGYPKSSQSQLKSKAKSFFLFKTCLLSFFALLLLPLFLIHNASMMEYSPTRTMANNGTTTTTTTTTNNDMTVSNHTQLMETMTPKAPRRQHEFVRHEEGDGRQASSDALLDNASACSEAVLPRDTRIVLLTVVQALHGSTALSSVLMSSPNIATYCSGRTWQCEGFARARQLVCRPPLGRRRTECFRDERQRSGAADGGGVKNGGGGSSTTQHQQQPSARLNLLDLLSFDWNLSRPILHDKLFPREPGYTQLWQSSLQRGQRQTTSMGEVPLSPQMVQHGIRHVRPAYIIMWTPLCVLNVQTTSRRALTSSNPDIVRHFLQEELWNLQHMRALRESLVSAQQGDASNNNSSTTSTTTPVLVMSFADLLFAPDLALERLNAFLPCAATHVNDNSSSSSSGLTTTYLPQLNVDVFPENKWKVRGTVHDFAQRLNASDCCGYNSTTGKCMDKTNFKLIPEFEAELMELESYFYRHSRT